MAEAEVRAKAVTEVRAKAKAEAELALIAIAIAAAEAETEAEADRPVATLVVNAKSKGRYQLTISSNFYEEKIKISATRKGFKAISYNVNTDASGNYSIVTSQKLSGFTLKVVYDDEDGNSYVLDSVKVK